MSATIDVQKFARFVGGKSLSAEGKAYPVNVRYFGDVTVPTAWRLEARVARGIRRALKETNGNILVFLPGKGEISACFVEMGGRRPATIPQSMDATPLGKLEGTGRHPRTTQDTAPLKIRLKPKEGLF